MTLAYVSSLYIRWRYLVLLGTLLLVLVVQPISFGFAASSRLFDVFLILVTIALLLSLCTERKRRLAALLFGIPIVLLSLSSHLVSAENAIVLVGHCLAVAFFSWAAVMIVASLLRSTVLSLDSVFGAICGYLLLGMAWGVLYSMLDVFRPGSFEIGERLARQMESSDSRIHVFTYYSFITLTTVGYGDVTPISAAARTCAWLEALTGQFYLAVLVAGLVGTLLTRKGEAGDLDHGR